ncbi:hypothetical protein LOTGIDRAFT_231643 [Lottia gigantea]|uniref:Neurotransmitter-gated ion-channel ligand-binding domain-containing protein n=1 Tax=Lottia gigantea TaxID=225164 RepID=V3ZZ27_LOTGI|nr:hypothetical protein LOTGIDRAFT_231643 [Lottia gigantea]ESO96803.1 hypothetical protein LOTGIDRAFT_231643 [Lottia gigantea]
MSVYLLPNQGKRKSGTSSSSSTDGTLLIRRHESQDRRQQSPSHSNTNRPNDTDSPHSPNITTNTNSFTPANVNQTPSPGKDLKLADTFRNLMVTLEKSNAIMQSCANAVINLNEKVTPEKEVKQFLGSRKEKVTVEIKCAFLKIIDIETLDQIFEAEVFVQAKWQEPALAELAAKNDIDNYDPSNYWIPRMTVLNTDGELEWNRRSFTVHFKEEGYEYPVVLLLWRFKGKFRENLELEHFPFDVQDLTIQLSTERSADEVVLIEDQHVLCTVNTRAFQDAQEWSIYQHVETFRDQTTQEYVSSTIHPILFVQCRVKRKIGYFMWNIIFIVLLILALTFSTLPIDPFNADRMSVTITLFLTAVAFKLVVKQSLPTISYLTYLDIYVLATLVFLGLQIAENSVMAGLCRIMSRDEVFVWDVYAVTSLAIILLFFHLLFVIHIYLTAYRRRRLMKQKDRLYQAKKRHLEKYGVMMKADQASALAIKMNQLPHK